MFLFAGHFDRILTILRSSGFPRLLEFHLHCTIKSVNSHIGICLSMFVYHQSLLYWKCFYIITIYFHDNSSLTPILISQIFYKSANQVIDFPNNRKNKKHHYESNNTKHNICKLHCTCIGYFLTDFNCKCND